MKNSLLIRILMIFIFAAVVAIDYALGTGGVAGVTLAMAGGGSTVRNSQVADGAGWDNKYGIALAYAALLENVEETVADGNTKITGWYNSATTFQTNKAEYDGFPIGSVIYDIVAGTIEFHQTATTWIQL
jgi:hypothetical protein